MKTSMRSILSPTRQENIIRTTAIGSMFSHSARIGTFNSISETTKHMASNPSHLPTLSGYDFDNHQSSRHRDDPCCSPRNLSGNRMRFSTSMAKSDKESKDIDYDGVPDDVAKLINDHAKQPPTSVSLQALMRTGRGEYLDRHFDVAMKEHTATELVLMQVASFLRRELPIRLAHRVQDLEKVRTNHKQNKRASCTQDLCTRRRIKFPVLRF